ncbi:cytokine receptor-like isoform X2 [Antedon mediterranea]
MNIIYILASLFIQAYHSNARAVTTSPMDPTLPAGSDLNITCTLDNSTTYTSRDIIWTTSYDKDTDRIDPSKIDIISDRVAMLRLQNLAMVNDKDDEYHCYLPNSLWHGTVLHIGTAPTKPTLNCFSTNIIDYWCEWSKTENTNLKDAYKFEYEYENDSWRTCPEKVGEFRCNINSANSPGVPHRIRVTVTNKLDKASTQIKFDSHTAAIPRMPSIKKVEPTNATLRITVQLQPDAGRYKNSLRYQIRYCKNDTNENWKEDSDDDNRYNQPITIIKLEPYTWYNLQARSKYIYNDWSDWGPTYSAKTLDGKPEGHVNFSVTEKNYTLTRDILVQWTTFSEDELNGKLKDYQVTLWQNDSIREQQNVSAGSVNKTIKKISMFEQFYVSVVAFNSYGKTKVIKKQIPDRSSEPGKPRKLEATAMSTSEVHVSWKFPRKPGSSNLNTYVLEWRKIDSKVSPENVTIDSNSTEKISYNVKDLEACTIYKFKVKARNEHGDGEFSILNESTKQTVPGNVTSISVQPEKMNSTVLSISWTPPKKPECVMDYNIHYQEYPNGDVNFLSLNSKQQSYNLANLKPFSEYKVWMTVSNNAGEGPSSVHVTKKTSQGTPSVPKNIKHNSTNNSFTIVWDAPSEKNGLIHYLVKLNQTLEVKNTTDTNTVFQNLFGYTVYEVSVSACSESLVKPCSEEGKVYITTLIGVPGPPQDVKFLKDTNELQWSEPTHPNGPKIDHYVVAYGKENDEEEERRTMSRSLDVDVKCNTKNLQYTFSVKAVNKDENGDEIKGPANIFYESILCTPTPRAEASSSNSSSSSNNDPFPGGISTVILIPGVIILTFVLVIYIYKHKYHAKYFKPWPDPKFLHIVIDPKLSPPPREKEIFDDLKTRPNNKTTIGSTTSSDQGFHDMSNSVSQIEEKMQEQGEKDKTVGTSHSFKEIDDDDAFYPQEQKKTEKEMLCKSGATLSGNTRQEYFNKNYEGNFVEGEIPYRHLVKRGSKVELVFSMPDNTSNIDQYTKMVPISPTSMNSIRPFANEDSGYVPSTNVKEINYFNSDNNKLGYVDKSHALVQDRNSEPIIGDYITNDGRLPHPVSNTLADDFTDTASEIDDYSQMEILSKFLDNIPSTIQE